MKECCILQMEAVHEEVLPSLIYTLNNLDYIPTLFINIKSKTRKGSIFDYCTQLNYNIHYVQFGNVTKWSDLQHKINAQSERLDFMIITTYQIDKMAEFYKDFKIPLIGIIHNGKLFKNNSFCKSNLENKLIYGLCLAKHPAIYVRNKCNLNQDNIAYFEPFYMDDSNFNTEQTSIKINNTICIGITGSVVFNDRAFLPLINQLKSLNEEKLQKEIKFVVCGGGKNRNELESLIKESRLERFFLLAPNDKETGYVSYTEYIKHLKKCHFLISLFNSDAIHYLHFKISSVITSALAYNIPMLFDSRASIVYSNPSLNYNLQFLETSLAEISKINQDEYDDLFHDCCQYRDYVIKNSHYQITNVVNYIRQNRLNHTKQA